MKLNHVALNIESEGELVNFYQNILGFHSAYQFNMPAELAATLFEVRKQVNVFLYKKDDILLELFVHSVNTNQNFAHLCFEVKNRESITARCEQSGYPVIRIKRKDKNDLLFIKDQEGNIFELKEGE